MTPDPRINLIKAIGRSGLNLEELACFTAIPVAKFIKVARGEEKLTLHQQEILAEILGCRRRDLFE